MWGKKTYDYKMINKPVLYTYEQRKALYEGIMNYEDKYKL